MVSSSERDQVAPLPEAKSALKDKMTCRVGTGYIRMCRSEDIGDNEALVLEAVESHRTLDDGVDSLSCVLENDGINVTWTPRVASHSGPSARVFMRNGSLRVFRKGIATLVRKVEHRLDRWTVGDDVGPPEFGPDASGQDVFRWRVAPFKPVHSEPYVASLHQILLDLRQDSPLLGSVRLLVRVIE